MSEQHPEEQASEDLMAGSSTSEREEEDYESESEDEEQTESDRKAAAALTSFVASSATASSTKSDQQTPHEASEKEFKIPLRFTKSGRKRAVPFPIKVCYSYIRKRRPKLQRIGTQWLTSISFLFIFS
jgi:hypothetical protein